MAGLESFPDHCPSCRQELAVSRLVCAACGHEIEGPFAPGRLVNLPEPHATLLEQFLAARGNMKEMERELGLAYSTVRSRLDAAFESARQYLHRGREDPHQPVLDALNRGEIDVPEALRRLRELKVRNLQ